MKRLLLPLGWLLLLGGCTADNDEVPDRGDGAVAPPVGCDAGAIEAQICGLNGAGGQRRSCTDGAWGPWSACTDPDVCTEDEAQTGTCGENDAGSQTRSCVGGRWSRFSPCVDPDERCSPDGAQVGCGLNGRGEMTRTCEDGRYTPGPCTDGDACVDGGLRVEACEGDDAAQRQWRCVEGAWVEAAECVAPGGCVDGESQAAACPEEGERARSCEAGVWSAWSGCPVAGVCADGETQRSTCGPGRGMKDRACVDGAWGEWGSCELEAECAEDETETEACGETAEGTRVRGCAGGAWAAWGPCEDPTRTCEPGSTEQVLCGLNRRGAQERACEDGRWGALGPCDDADVCIDGADESGACGARDAGARERACVDGQWAAWSDCVEPGVCEDGEQQAEPCGLNDRGERVRSCIDGDWPIWGGCEDPDSCVDGVDARQECGLNGRGEELRACEAGQWLDWGLCADPDDCEDGANEAGDCPDGGPRERSCVRGVWAEWSACELQPSCHPDQQIAIGAGIHRIDTRGTAGGMFAGCGGGALVAGSERVLVLELDEPGFVDIAVTAADFDTVLYIRSQCDDRLTEEACNDDGEPPSTHSRIQIALDAGTWFVVLDGYRGEVGTATVEVAIEPLLDCEETPDLARCRACWDTEEPNNTMASAVRLRDGDGLTDLKLCFDADPFDWYEVRVSGPSTLWLNRGEAERSISASVFDANRQLVVATSASPWWGHDFLPEAGRYFIRLSAGTDDYDYDLSVRLDRLNACQWTDDAPDCVACDDPDGENNSAESAFELQVDGRLHQGDSVCVGLDPEDFYFFDVQRAGMYSAQIEFAWPSQEHPIPKLDILSADGEDLTNQSSASIIDHDVTTSPIRLGRGRYYVRVAMDPLTAPWVYEYGVRVERTR